MDDALTQNLSPDALANVQRWLNEEKFEEYRDELQSLIRKEEWSDLEDAFFKVIEFGTAGRRGATGVGSNRINRVTVGESAQALCLYAQSVDENAKNRGVVIAYDTRLSSGELSRYAAQVCAANGFKTYLFDGFRSTPELSFAVRELDCAVGIVITASHNPPIDNGFKAYWDDGAQMVAPHDKGLMEFVNNVELIKSTDYEDAVRDEKIILVSKELDEKYIAAVADQAEGTERNVSIVYSPLHGAGQTNTLPVLARAGFTSVASVEEQMVPDGNFPTIESRKPNPEDKIANELVVKLLHDTSADIAISNDPDADRIGVMVRQGSDTIYLSGNQSAILATEYSLKKLQEKGELTENHYVAKTIVTSDMIDAIAERYGVKCYGDMLIGFKYIGELIRSKESTDETFVIGMEESFGLLKGDYARDKDGAAGALPLAEYAAELKLEDETLYDELLDLYSTYGIFAERLDSIVCPGASGFAQMQSIMAKLRSDPPKSVNGAPVTAVLDYQTLKKTTSSGDVSDVECTDKGNVIVLEFGDRRKRITFRPSGTEPKLKLYVQWFEDTLSTDREDVKNQYAAIQDELEKMAKELESQLLD